MWPLWLWRFLWPVLDGEDHAWYRGFCEGYRAGEAAAQREHRQATTDEAAGASARMVTTHGHTLKRLGTR